MKAEFRFGDASVRIVVIPETENERGMLALAQRTGVPVELDIEAPIGNVDRFAGS